MGAEPTASEHSRIAGRLERGSGDVHQRRPPDGHRTRRNRRLPEHPGGRELSTPPPHYDPPRIPAEAGRLPGASGRACGTPSPSDGVPRTSDSTAHAGESRG
ncbi:hypothetical protein OPAG_06729 [Rhodococcus opacus PD630]|nr:hypothetical protein OPAG_06729 [Rhodococcus opacus PD630]